MATFRNPILPGFHPDPSICRVGRDFYLVTSSFEYFPGVPIFHSRDLVHWRQIGHVLSQKRQLRLDGIASSGGIYAPTLRHCRGFFYLVTTCVGGGGNFYVKAKRPEGPWSDPVWLDDEGIDPSFFIEGKISYYTRTGKGKDRDHPFIYQGTVDLRSGKIEEKLRVIWRGTGGVWTEGPHLYKIGSFYYLLAAEGGTAYDHSIVVARSQSPFGPFEAYRRNPILTHRSRKSHPIQATGHADLVQLADGSFWAVLLAIRPKSGRHHHLGRETFLAPVTFGKEGWPAIGVRQTVELEMSAPPLGPHEGAASPARDDFDQAALAPCWNFLRNPVARDWSLSERSSCLCLHGSRVTLDDVGSPAFVGRRQEHLRMRCRTMLHFASQRPNEEAGLTVRANERHHYDVFARGGVAKREILLRSCIRGQKRIVRQSSIPDGPIRLELRATDERYTFAVTVGRRTLRLGSLPTRSLSAETIARDGKNYFTGVYLAMYATGNGRRSSVSADFDWFEYRPE